MSFVTDLKRIIRSGIIGFWRNGVVSFASILTMTVTLFLVASLIFSNAILDFSLEQIQRRVDINIYFYPQSSESVVLELQETLEQLPEVHSVTYVTRGEAIEQFRERHKDNPLTLQALDELGVNPLGASLNVRAMDPGQYGIIAEFLASDHPSVYTAQSSIEEVNYNQNKLIIDRLNAITSTAQKLGFAISLVFIILTVIITFNTIRLAIFSSREEIEIMRLVGAENPYIRGPFMIQGVLYGGVASIITLVLLYPLTLWINAHTQVFFGGMDIFYYYLNNFPQILLIIVFVGVLLGAFSSYLAIRTYLKK